MREIKFRAWIDNAMCYDIAELEFQYFCIVVNDHPSGDRGFSIDNAELMQSTGLKDKNGVEIWEGDVVKLMDDDWSETDDWEKEDPRWQDDAYFESIPKIEMNRDVVVMDRFPVFWLKKEEFGYEGEDLQAHSTYEVIGNIHENPDLV